jgi:sugar phosphate isomerase/epimerase
MSIETGAGGTLAKLKVLSTHIFLKQRLHPGLLELAVQSGAQAVEIFAARPHFDYTSREQVDELAGWFRSSSIKPWSMHSPLRFGCEIDGSSAPSVNLLHPEKARRIDAMDEIKRALATAEKIPFQNLVVHLGEREDAWSPRSAEYAFVAIEYLNAFAHPLGVRLLLENLTSEATAPEHLMKILETGHLDSVGVCLDLGHAHLTAGIPAAMATLDGRIVQIHAHDNHGVKDEHLFPGDGGIDWPATVAALNGLAAPPAVVLELSSRLTDAPATWPDRIRAAFDLLA